MLKCPLSLILGGAVGNGGASAEWPPRARAALRSVFPPPEHHECPSCLPGLPCSCWDLVAESKVGQIRFFRRGDGSSGRMSSLSRVVQLEKGREDSVLCWGTGPRLQGTLHPWIPLGCVSSLAQAVLCPPWAEQTPGISLSRGCRPRLHMQQLGAFPAAKPAVPAHRWQRL